jgi:hypothetical protein
MRSVRRLTSGRDLRPVIVAAVALLLVAGSAFAASPSSPPSSPSASAVVSGNPTAAASNAPEASEASEAPERSEAPDASEAPEASEAPDAVDKNDAEGGPPSAAEITRVVGRLSDAGITTTDAALQALASKMGLGGAVRVLAFAHASGKTPAQIVDMFQAGTGWGQIRHQLNLSIGPGIGWIMGGGHGNPHKVAAGG